MEGTRRTDDAQRPSGADGTVGVRELRQNLSVYLQRIKQGDELTVTERGVPVARLSPLPAPQGPLAELLALGLARPPIRPGGIRDLPPPLKLPPGMSISRILDEQRDDRL